MSVAPDGGSGHAQFRREADHPGELLAPAPVAHAGPQVFGGLIGDGQTAQAFHVLKFRMRPMNAPHRSMRNNLCAGLFAFFRRRASIHPAYPHPRPDPLSTMKNSQSPTAASKPTAMKPTTSQKPARRKTTRILTGTIAALLAIHAAAPALRAAPVTWDTAPGTVGAGNSTITGGVGTWDPANASNGNWTVDGGVIAPCPP